MGYHAKLSPSGSSRWTDCTASINEQDGLPNENSEASMIGTVCHQICAEVLQAWVDTGTSPDHDLTAEDYAGRIMMFWAGDGLTGEDWREDFVIDGDPNVELTGEVIVTDDMVTACNAGLEIVRTRVLSTDAHVEIEQRVPIGHYTGEPGATGTSDVILIYGQTIESLDFKFGFLRVDAYDVLVPARGETPPTLRMNLQLANYVLGAYEKFNLIYDFDQCKAVIIQPFLYRVSEYGCSMEELLDLQENFLRVKAEETRTNPVHKPTEDNCHFCKARTTCIPRDEKALALVSRGFTADGRMVRPPTPSDQHLAAVYGELGFIKEWCDDVAKKVLEALKSGFEVVRPDGLRYVMKVGRKGDRQWADPKRAEALLKEMQLQRDEIFVSKLVGPATIEGLAKVRKRPKANTPPPRLTTDQWEQLKELITQKDGSPAVALETDVRPNLPSSAEGFTDVSDDLSDLMN